jgi:threonine dehydrogenase-like Zn-dependent dehydrogenase
MKTALVTGEGKVVVVDRAALPLLKRSARIRVRRSLISTGTETDVIRSRRSAAAGEDLCPGYSAVGEVLEVSPDCRKGRPGLRVACAGWGLATHSQQIVVPENLFVPVPEGADDDNAAFIGCAVTCMHACRQGAVSGGDVVAVIGMGLFGQMVARIAGAFGAVVYALAKHPHQADRARQVCRQVWQWSGAEPAPALPADLAPADVVVITAGGEQSEMIRAAGKMLRDRGTVVILGRGWATLDFRQEMFQKELTLRNTRAYGPGRYDSQYEREGVDYPVGYVRWTENRNMAAVLDLMARGLLDLRPLITDRCRLEDIPAAYEKLLAKPNRQIAIAVEYL